MIPDAAVQAVAAVLLGYTGGCTCHEGYSGRNLIDPECSYHDVPPEVARLILEAAAPHMTDKAAETRLLAIAWTEAYGAGFQEGAGFGPTPNPYRSQAHGNH